MEFGLLTAHRVRHITSSLSWRPGALLTLPRSSTERRHSMHRFSTMLFSTVLVGALALAYPPKATASTRLPQEDWSWLNDTYWYVTPDDLPAVATDLTTQQHEPVLDQTVWFI